MGSDDERDRPSRRGRHEDDEDDRRTRNRDRDGADDSEKRKDSGRDRERRRSRDRRDRRRSCTPESSSRRPRSRDRHRDRDRDDRRDRDRHRREKRSRHEESPRRKSRRDRDVGNKEDDGQKSAGPLQRSGPLPSQEDSWAVTKGEEPEKPKEKPNYGNSGRLAAASNSVAQADGTTITLKYHEPPEARKPSPRDQWKLFVFKGADIVDEVDLGARSCWLVGREASVVDLLAEHPSLSKQHAVVQFRYTEKRDEFGDRKGRVKPYLIDLESANGTRLNGDRVPESRYLELRDKDMVQFGHSSREYVLMLAPKA